MNSLKITIAPSLRQQVADTIRSAIATGELRPGERLVERVLCERTGVSRTSLREALRELENEGLITNLPNRGLIITQLTKKAAKDVFDVRASLEALVCRLFCQNASDEQVDQCRAVHEKLTLAYREGVARSMIDSKTAFYDLLMAGAGNREAERMLRSIHIRVSQLRLMSLSDADRRQASMHELDALVDSLIARDAARAERLSRRHVDLAAKSALSKLDQ